MADYQILDVISTTWPFTHCGKSDRGRLRLAPEWANEQAAIFDNRFVWQGSWTVGYGSSFLFKETVAAGGLEVARWLEVSGLWRWMAWSESGDSR